VTPAFWRIVGGVFRSGIGFLLISLLIGAMMEGIRTSTLEALGRAITNGGVLFLAPGAGGGEGVRRAPTIVSVSREG
jgi:hypothetical protein